MIINSTLPPARLHPTGKERGGGKKPLPCDGRPKLRVQERDQSRDSRQKVISIKVRESNYSFRDENNCRLKLDPIRTGRMGVSPRDLCSLLLRTTMDVSNSPHSEILQCRSYPHPLLRTIRRSFLFLIKR